MQLSEHDLEFLAANQSAAMITVADGVAKPVRVGVAVVDGKVWSSGTQERKRTARLRADPRCTLYVHDSGYGFLALETVVTILDGPDAPQLNLRLMRQMQNRPTGPISWFNGELSEEDFLAAMVEEGRLVYECDIRRAYGMH